MASGFVKAELTTCRQGRPQISCRLLYKSVLLLVFGLILWKWMNGVDSLGSNQECRIGYRHSHSRVSQCLASIRKLGNRRSSEGLRSFKPSKGTNLFILIILAGDIEMNPGPRFQCGLCKKYCKASDRLLECEECEKRFHASCSNLSDNELVRIESGDGAWYCTNCKADCGLCSGAVLKGHKAVRCDSCDMWIHNECSFIAETQYEIVNNTNCTWICPKCEFFNFSDSFFGEQVNLETENRFVPLTKEKKDRSPPCGINKSSFISGLKFISMNINSIRGKKLELLAFLDFHQPHVVAIQETKIDSSIATSELFPETCPYSVYRKDRNIHGGGVMLLVHKDISHMPITELENDSESIWVKVFANKTSHFVASWYRPPGSTSEEFKLFREQLDYIKTRHKGKKLPSAHVLGDFNFKDIDWPDRLSKSGSTLSQSEGQILIDIMNDHGLEQMVHFPTREKNTLDLILTTLPGQFQDVHSPDKLSDHDIVSGTLKIFIPPIKKPRRKVYLYQKGDYESMRKDTLEFAKEKYFNGHSDTRSVQENFDLLTSFIQDSADKHIPSKTSRSVSSIPWITPEIRRKIRRKNKTHAKAKKTGSSKLRSKFETLRREIKAEVRKQHDLYVNNLVGDVKANPRDFYRYINSQKKDTQGIPPLKRKNGKGVAQSDLEKAEEFNGQFTDVFSKNEHTQVPLLDRSAPFMNDIAVSKDGVIKLLKGLNPSKALGPDELHPRVLKELATELGPVFAHLFQQSIETGEIPKEWSLANICPLFKKSDRSLACNYRPVSLTCVPCKLLEHIVCSNIMAHLDEYKLLSDRQHAFRKGHSCETQLTTVINDWAKILDNRGQVDTFILDFEKAFDTPPHELLKSKLFSYGIGGKTLKWIDSFLCFRQQRVVVNGVKSDWAPVLSGVPQGTVLGPLLFSLYINDISSDIESEIRLFADDCVCYREIKDEKDTMKLQRDIDRLGSWARKWGMRFQPVKCNMMQLTRKRIKKIHASYTLEGTNLENVESIKYLGVTITSDLRWNTHVSNVCTKANRTLGFLRRNLYSCPQEVKEAAYKGLVRPVLDYGSSVWDPPGVVLQEELESVQKRAARFVTGNYNYETWSMTGILGQLKWESLKKRRKDNRLILLYKGLKGKASVPTDDLIPKTRRCRNQHSMAFQTPIANTDVYKGSFFPQTIRDWNALPDSLISSAEDAEDCIAKFTSLVRARD